MKTYTRKPKATHTMTICLFGNGEPLPKGKGYTTPFEQGRGDRLIGKPCACANGEYLDGYYSLPNTFKSPFSKA